MKNIVLRDSNQRGMVVFILMVHFGNFVRMGTDLLQLDGTTGLLDFLFFYFQTHIFFLILHFWFSQKPSKEVIDDKFPPLGRWFSENKTSETKVNYDNLELTMVFSLYLFLFGFSFSFLTQKSNFLDNIICKTSQIRLLTPFSDLDDFFYFKVTLVLEILSTIY